MVGTTLTTGNISVGGPSYATASITPAAKALVTIAINAAAGPPGDVQSVVGCNLNWLKVPNGSVDYAQPSGSANTRRLEVWYAMGASPTTGAITITMGVNVNITWCVSQFTGVNTSGNGRGAIGNIATAGSGTSGGSSGSPMTVNLSFTNAANGTYGAAGIDDLTAISAGTSMTLLNATAISPSAIDEWAAGNVSPVTATWAGGANHFWAIIAFELVVPVVSDDYWTNFLPSVLDTIVTVWG